MESEDIALPELLRVLCRDAGVMSESLPDLSAVHVFEALGQGIGVVVSLQVVHGVGVTQCVVLPGE